MAQKARPGIALDITRPLKAHLAQNSHLDCCVKMTPHFETEREGSGLPQSSALQGAGSLKRQDFEKLFGSVNDAVSVHDEHTGKVVYVNKEMRKMYGLCLEELTGSGAGVWSSDISSYTEKDALHKMRKAAEEGPQFFRWLSRRRNGDLFEVQVILTLTVIERQRVLLAVIREVSNRRRAEEELKRTREYLDTVLNSIQDAVFLHELDGKIIAVNKRMMDIYRVNQEEAGGFSIRDDYSSEENPLDELPDIWRRVLAGEHIAFEWKARRPKDGSTFDAEVALRRIPGSNNDLVLALVRDISDRKRFSAVLQIEKNKFQTLCESSPVGMAMGSADNTLQYLNPKYVELFGYDLEEIPTVAEWFNKAYPDPAYRRQAIEYWRKYVKTSKPGERKAFIRRVTCKNGAEKIINFMPVELEAGCILMICEDITELKQAENELRRRNIELGVLNEIITSLNNSLHFSDLLETLKDIFTTKLGIPSGGLFFYDEQTEKIRLDSYWGIPDEGREEFESFFLEVLKNRKLIGQEEVALLDTDSMDSRRIPTGVGPRPSRYLFVPVVHGETQGMIILSSPETEGLYEGQLSFLKTLGRQIGVAVQNARLFEEVNRSHARMKELSLRLLEVQELERAGMARELHDEIGQTLTVVKFLIEQCAGVLSSEDRMSSCFREAQLTVSRLMGATRELSLRLRPAMLDDLGLLPTLHWHFERFTTQTNINVVVKQVGMDHKRFSRHAETAIYRIAQEALTNVARHAESKEVIVRLWANDYTLGLQIEDHGKGFDPEAVWNSRNTFGLRGMRERATLLGGQFSLEAQVGGGCRVTAELPLNRDEQ